MLVSLVVAMTRNRVIGRDNALPWRLPADLQHFKSVTLGKPILMGRRTFVSIGRPLPGRTNLVLTRDRNWSCAGVIAVRTLEEAYERAGDAPELAGIGGAEIFSLLLPVAMRIHLTRIEADIAGDTWFPALDAGQWHETAHREFRADDRNAYDMSFVTLERVPAAAR